LLARAVGAQGRAIEDLDAAALHAHQALGGEVVQDAREVLGREVEARGDQRFLRRQRRRPGLAAESAASSRRASWGSRSISSKRDWLRTCSRSESASAVAATG
jgi:hypothetical protein